MNIDEEQEPMDIDYPVEIDAIMEEIAKIGSDDQTLFFKKMSLILVEASKIMSINSINEIVVKNKGYEFERSLYIYRIQELERERLSLIRWINKLQTDLIEKTEQTKI